jgi:hypothetical protein
MRPHHTKDKGDLGVLHAMVDLREKGYILLQPMTEHAPFDLVAYKDERFLRVQVKYRAAVAGAVTVPFTSSWADRHGTHSVPVDKSSIDVVCIYCPDTRLCYYVDPLAVRRTVVLRVAPARNRQQKGIAWAKDHTQIPSRLCGVPPGLEAGAIVGQSSPSSAHSSVGSEHSASTGAVAGSSPAGRARESPMAWTLLRSRTCPRRSLTSHR